MSAVIYTRVSTEDQTQHGISLDAQLAACTEYAQTRGLPIADVIVDAGLSGKNTVRPGYQKLIKLVTTRKVHHVVCMKLDRLSRSTIDTLNLLNLLGQKSVQLHLTDSGVVDSQSSDGEMMVTLKAAFSQAERRKISERTRAALARKRQLGQRISGIAPFGFQFRDGMLAVNESEQQTIAVMRGLRDSGLSIRNIISELHDMGYHNREGHPFSISVVHKLLQAS